jgi:hypothetical protein
MNKRWKQTMLFCLALTGISSAEDFEISWSNIDSGGVMLGMGGPFTLSATIGQPDAGEMAGGPFEVSGGFLVEAVADPPAPCACGDIDGNGAVDLIDFTTFATCMGLMAPEPVCEGATYFCSDMNGDGRINLIDFSMFLTAYGEPPMSSPPDC